MVDVGCRSRLMQEARLKQSLFECRQKLTLLHCVSKVTCVSVHVRAAGAMGWAQRCGLGAAVSVVGSRHWMGAPTLQLFIHPRGCPGPATGAPEQLLCCEGLQQCLESSYLPGQ